MPREAVPSAAWGALRFGAIAAALALAFPAPPARAQMRMEVIPFESVTLTAQQVLLGEPGGKPVTLAGELRLPRRGAEKVPVVILVHGLGGLMANHDDWARLLDGWGIGVFLPDHLSGRGLSAMSPEDGRLTALPRTVDAFRALARIARHPRVDAERIAVMGFSLGGAVALITAQERLRKLYGPPDAQFAAHVALYPACFTRIRDDAQVAPRPIRTFHGTGDDATPVEQCRPLIADMKRAGADVVATEFPGVAHAYDNGDARERVRLAQVPALRKCSLLEGGGGDVLDGNTGKIFGPGAPCVEMGISVQYDEAATVKTREAVKAALASALAPKPAAAAPPALARTSGLGTAAEAKAMLERAVVALKADKANALEMFQKGQGGFRDRDLYVFCAGSDGNFTAHPALLGAPMTDFVDRDGRPAGQEMFQAGQEGRIAEVTYMWPRPGQTEPAAKTSYVTKVGDQVCAVGHYR